MHFKTDLRFAARIAAGLVFSFGVAPPATAQTIRLTDSSATVLRGGTYANTNASSAQVLATRASSDATNVRRILLKFDTHNLIPANTAIASAKLTLTVAGGNGETRRIVPYRIASSYEETQATWNRRKSGVSWGRAGGDIAEAYAGVSVTDTVGSQVSLDVTGLVRGAVSGTFGSLRYTRIALIDTGSSSQDSYKEYFSDEAGDSSVRPVLTVTYGATTTATAPSTSTTGTAVRVLHWNTRHGGIGTDGRYDPARIASFIAKINPEIVSLNEVDNTTQLNAIVSRVNAATGITWKTAYSGWGNLIMTRLALNNRSVCLFNVSAGRKAAHLSTLVNGRPVNIWSGHLDVDSASARLSEVKALRNCADDWSEGRIVAGDYNMQASSAEYANMATYYKDAWAEAKRLGTTTNYSGNCDGCTRNSRIDYVFASRGSTSLSVKSARIYDTRDSNGVMPSDHKPLLVTYNVR